MYGFKMLATFKQNIPHQILLNWDFVWFRFELIHVYLNDLDKVRKPVYMLDFS